MHFRDAAFVAPQPRSSHVEGDISASVALRATPAAGAANGVTEEQWSEVIRLPRSAGTASAEIPLRRPDLAEQEKIALRLPRSWKRQEEPSDLGSFYCAFFLAQLAVLFAVVDWSKF
eukprot:TRINITY_DN16522_c0_g1_i1.p1 TRINITY_DN16522_c0_g1~~TRINITY_DN16522_c0_g1_i1.p1  ORF type:complete len:133 (+),score=26.15 TRINITY_DN16522_c0_g1_i1:50-400(+)